MAIPNHPATVFVTRIVNNTANVIRWTPVTTDTAGAPLTIQAYKVYRTQNPSGLDSVLWKSVETLDASGAVDTAAVDFSIDPTSNYFYRVIASTLLADSDGSAEATDLI